VSTVVVVKKAGVAAIAADSCTSFGDLHLRGSYTVANGKIVEHPSALIAIAGSAAHKPVLQSELRDPKKYGFSNSQSIFESMLSLHAKLKKKYFLNPVEDDDDPYESTQFEMLIANPSGIFGITSLREVYEYTTFWAMGTGCDFALGAMFAAYPVLDSAEEIARRGVEAGAEFDSSTAGPFDVRSVRLRL
jgi:ATP-dependent HslUV protease subunit HslV